MCIISSAWTPRLTSMLTRDSTCDDAAARYRVHVSKVITYKSRWTSRSPGKRQSCQTNANTLMQRCIEHMCRDALYMNHILTSLIWLWTSPFLFSLRFVLTKMTPLRKPWSQTCSYIQTCVSFTVHVLSAFEIGYPFQSWEHILGPCVSLPRTKWKRTTPSYMIYTIIQTWWQTYAFDFWKVSVVQNKLSQKSKIMAKFCCWSWSYYCCPHRIQT